MNRKSFTTLEKLGGWMLGILTVAVFLFLIVGTGETKGLYPEVAEKGLEFAERLLPIKKYDESSMPKEQTELIRFQERFLESIKKKGTECLVPYSLTGIGDGALGFFKSGSGTIASAILTKGKEREQKLNPQPFDGEFCVINAPNFRRTYDVGDDRCFELSRAEQLHSDVITSFIVGSQQIILQTPEGEQKFDYNRGYLFKPDDNKFCFIPTHRVYVGSLSSRCREEKYSVYIDSNEKLVKAVGICKG